MSSGCWEWQASKRSGYGAFGVAAGDIRPAHRVAWELTNGPIPDGAQLCHSCDNRACVRPDHMFLGTQADNIADMHQKGRYARGDRHGRRKLTAESVAEMRRLYATGNHTVEGLGLLFGVAGSTVSLNVRGLKWQEAGGPIADPFAHWKPRNQARLRDSGGRYRSDHRRTCYCTHRYSDHANNGTRCLAWVDDPGLSSLKMCYCPRWAP